MSRKQDVAPGNWDLTPLNPTWIIYKPISTSNQIKPIHTYESRSVARIIGSPSLGPTYSVNFTNQGHNSNLPSMLTIKKGRQWKSQEDYRKEERKSPCLGRQGVEKSNWLKAVEGRSWLAAWLHQPQMITAWPDLKTDKLWKVKKVANSVICRTTEVICTCRSVGTSIWLI